MLVPESMSTADSVVSGVYNVTTHGRPSIAGNPVTVIIGGTLTGASATQSERTGTLMQYLVCAASGGSLMQRTLGVHRASGSGIPWPPPDLIYPRL